MLCQAHFQLFQDQLIGINIVIIKVDVCIDAVNFPVWNILQSKGTPPWGFAVTLNAVYGPVNGISLNLHLLDLMDSLLPFADQYRFNLAQILRSQYFLNFFQFHSQFLHILNHVQPCILAHIVIAVTGLRIRVTGLQDSN